MKENINKLDQFFEKAFTGFEEPPPAEVKSSVFKRMLFFNAWRSIKKYVVIFMILMMVSGIAYISVSFLTGTSGQSAYKKSSGLKMEKNIFSRHKNTIDNLFVHPTNIESENSDLKLNNTVNDPSHSKQIAVNPIQYPNKSPSGDQEKGILHTNTNNFKPIQNDKTITSQIISSNSNNNTTNQQTNVPGHSNVTNEKSADTKFIKTDTQDNITENKMGNSPDVSVTNELDSVAFSPSKKSANGKNRKTPLLWSVGANVGHSLLQSDLINTSENLSDNGFKKSSKLNFPSGFVGLNVRGEKKHLFFDFGLQYSNFSEKISTNQLLYNLRDYQDIISAGQNTVIDTNGGYWHYFYISTTTINKYDSIWTWRIDSSLVSIYDTTYKKKFDTLRNSSWINTYSLFELPLNIGWMNNFGKVKLGFGTGPIFSLLVGTKGKMPYYITNGKELIATKQEFQKFRFGISWQVSGIFDYQLTRRMLIEFSPYYRYTLLPYKSSVSAATVKHNSLGLQLGLRYYF